MPNSKNWFARHKILTAIIAVIVIIAIASAAGGNKNNSSTNTNSAQSTTSSNTKTSTNAAAIPKIGQTASDGKFEFTVTSFKCGDTQIEQADNQYEVAQAQGQFCVMGLSVKNIASVSQSFDDSSQYIYNSANVQYSTSSAGTIAANPSSSQFMVYPTVNPGVTITGNLAFDIPKDATISSAKLHDSPYSNGVKVDLEQ